MEEKLAIPLFSKKLFGIVLNKKKLQLSDWYSFLEENIFGERWKTLEVLDEMQWPFLLTIIRAYKTSSNTAEWTMLHFKGQTRERDDSMMSRQQPRSPDSKIVEKDLKTEATTQMGDMDAAEDTEWGTTQSWVSNACCFTSFRRH